MIPRTAAVIVPMLHAGIIVVPIIMKVFLPGPLGAHWLDVFVLEAVLLFGRDRDHPCCCW